MQHPCPTADCFSDVGAGAAHWIYLKPPSGRLSVDHQTLGDDYLYRQIVRHVTPVRDWQSAQMNLCMRWQQQRLKATGPKKVAKHDSTLSSRRKDFERIDTTDGRNPGFLRIKVARDQEPSWLGAIVAQHDVKHEFDQRRCAVAHFVELNFGQRSRLRKRVGTKRPENRRENEKSNELDYLQFVNRALRTSSTSSAQS